VSCTRQQGNHSVRWAVSADSTKRGQQQGIEQARQQARSALEVIQEVAA
jgi:hypothetical protein